MSKKGLYCCIFTLCPATVAKIDKIESTNNWLLEFHVAPLDMDYVVYFGSNDTNDKLIHKLKIGTEVVVHGTVKSNKQKQTVLRAKQICVDE